MTSKKSFKSPFKNEKPSVPVTEREGQIDSNARSSSLASNKGYSNRGGTNDEAVRGAVRGRRNRGT